MKKGELKNMSLHCFLYDPFLFVGVPMSVTLQPPPPLLSRAELHFTSF